MLLVSLKCLQGLFTLCTALCYGQNGFKVFLPVGTLQAKVTSNMNLKKHDQNSGHPTQAISQRVAMKQSSVTTLIVKKT